MPLFDLTTIIVLLVAVGLTLAIGWRRPFTILAALVMLVPFRDFATRWLNVNTELSIQTVTALGRWWFALVLGLVLLLAAKALTNWRQLIDRVDLGLPDWLFLASMAVVLISIPLSPDRGAALTSARGYLQPMLLYPIARAIFPSRPQAKWFLVGLLLVGVIMAGFGLWQGFIWEEADFRAAGYVRQDGNLVTPPTTIRGERFIRPASTVSGPNELGLDMVVLFAGGMLMVTQIKSRLRWLGVPLGLLFTAGLVITFSRSAFLAYIAVWLALAWLLRRSLLRQMRAMPPGRRLALGLGLIGLMAASAAAFVLAGFSSYIARTISRLTETYHYVDTVEAIQYLFSNPLGAGMGMVEPKGALSLIEAGGSYHVEGSLLQIGVEMSVFGLLVWLIFWATALFVILKNWQKVEDPILQIVAGTAFAAWLGSLVAFLILPLMQSISLMVWLWLLLGLGVSVSAIDQYWVTNPEG